MEVEDVEKFNVGDLLGFDGIDIGSPTCHDSHGSMATRVKALLDESVKSHGVLEGKVGGAFSSSANIGEGNETTILDIHNALLIHEMIVQGTFSGNHYGPVSIGRPDKRVEQQCKGIW